MEKIILDGHKLAWHTSRLNAWLEGERIAPVTIDCALTRRCPYRCVYCYGQLQENDGKEITRDDIYRFLDDASEIGVKGVSFVSDGESTSSPHFYDAVLRGKENGIDMAVGTNGILLKEERLEDILPALTYLRFNISAGEPAPYARVHGCPPSCFEQVCRKIRACVEIKKRKSLPVTLGMQMVLLPEFSHQILPLARLGRELGVDYLVIKHCSDDENGTLGVDYTKYFPLRGLLEEAEALSSDDYLVKVKWSKIMSNGERSYSRCYGPPFLLQISGSGLVAPCGMLFNRAYKKYHIGNIAQKGLKALWKSDRYWQVMDFIASSRFDPRTMCGCLCLQHKINEFLWDIKHGQGTAPVEAGTGAMQDEEPPIHLNFL